MGREKGGNLMSTAEAAMANLSELSQLSKTLNEQSNQVNELLQNVERKLVEMNLGVEGWVVIGSDRYTETDLHENSIYWCAESQIGFSQWHDQWKLMFKRVHFERSFDIHGREDWVQRSEDSLRPLLQASRALRLEAMGHLEELFDALADEAKRVLQGIEKGQKSYRKLTAE